MCIKLVICDLDGVLVDSRALHFHALNAALSSLAPECVLTWDEHVARYDGLPTRVKLDKLAHEKGLKKELFSDVWRKKQAFTSQMIPEKIQRNPQVYRVLQKLKMQGYLVYVASNSIWKTTKDMLLHSDLLPFVDYFISAKDVQHSKPAPDMYMECMMRAQVSVWQTLICEDSPIGRRAALDSGAHLCAIADPNDFTWSKLKSHLGRISPPKQDLRWKRRLNVLIPMAGKGSRFVAEGYHEPKPFIMVHDVPMIQHVMDNLQVDAHFIFVVSQHLNKRYHQRLRDLAPGCQIVVERSAPQGAVTSILQAQELIDDDTPLLLANCDQSVEWDANQFLYRASSPGIDGAILTFAAPDQSPKWSYVQTDEKGLVARTAEKQPISTEATVGIYYWSQGSEFVKYAHQMIQANDRVNNEFYSCPVYNYAIQDGKKIISYPCEKMWGLGTPEDLIEYLLKHPQTRK